MNHNDSAPASQRASDTTRRAGLPQAAVLVACNLMPVMGVIALAPVLPLLLQHFAATPGSQFLVPIALTVPAICIALLSAPSGWLADRIGRRRMLIVALLLYAAFGVMPMALDDLKHIIASRIGLGVAEAMILTLATTLTGDYVSGERRKKWIGLSAAIGSVLASGIFAAAGALGQISWRGPFALYLMAIPIAALVAWLLWEPRADADANPRSPPAAGGTPTAGFPMRSMLWVYAFTLPVAMLFFVGPIHLGRVMNEIGITEPSRIGMATGLVHLGVPIGAVVFRFISKGPLWQVLALAVGCTGLPLLGLRWADGFGSVIALMLVSQFGCGLMLPSMMGWCLSHLPFAWRGRGSGLFTSVLFMGQFLTPLSFALLTRNAGGVLPAMFAFGMLSAATLAAVLIARMQWGGADQAEPPAASPAAGAVTTTQAAA